MSGTHCGKREWINVISTEFKRSSLVDATRHVFDVLGFVLQATVIVVGLHTCFDFTANGSAQLSAQSTFLENKTKKQFLNTF